MYPSQNESMPAYRAATQAGLDDRTTVMRPAGRDLNAASVQRPSRQENPSTSCPPSNMGWAAAALLFFWPLAFAAFSNAGSVATLWLSGDRVGAQHASDQAKKLGKYSLIAFAVLFVLSIVLYVVVIASAVSSMSAYHA
ncbi:CD225/dispanin family protein [Gordonia sputi]|uniref:CD225/dispanin family protein n=1 Tax=Gordonia sputi TaxID=36823 RepID=UPI0020439EBA|nr:CD225/dispanin family protein [Gordonia sputi]MCM3894172.1 CD225/dispanin family protein [Gordonia sputi]